jgi:hypothetical protein
MESNTSYTSPGAALHLHALLLRARLGQWLRLMGASPLASLQALLLAVFLLACALAYGALALPLVRHWVEQAPRASAGVIGLLSLGGGLGLRRALYHRLIRWHRRSFVVLWPLTPGQQEFIARQGSLVALALPGAGLALLTLILPQGPLFSPWMDAGLALGLLILIGAPWPGRLPGSGMAPALRTPGKDSLRATRSTPLPSHEKALSRLARRGYESPGGGLRLLPLSTGAAVVSGLCSSALMLALGLAGENGPVLQGGLALGVTLILLNAAWERIHAGRALLRLLPMDTRSFARRHLALVLPDLARVLGPTMVAAGVLGLDSLAAALAGMLLAGLLACAGALLHLVSDGYKHRELLAGLAWVLPSLAGFWIMPPLVPLVLGISTWRLWSRVRSVREKDAC